MMLLISILFLFLLLFFPTISLSASKYGFTLWLTELLPSLLPFFIGIRLFQLYLPAITKKKIFLLLGLLCGYPAGAALVMSQYEQGLLCKRQAYFFLGFVNNPSPMFVLAFCGESTLSLSGNEPAFILFLLIISSLIGSILFYLITCMIPSFSLKKDKPSIDRSIVPNKTLSQSNQLDKIILDSFIVLIKIGGYVIIFSILGQFINLLFIRQPLVSLFCTSALEITTGISFLKDIAMSLTAKKILTVMILSFGGLSAAAQTSSIISKSELSILPYILCKAGNSAISLILSLLCFCLF